MPARKTNSPDLQRLARDRLGAWRFGLKFARLRNPKPEPGRSPPMLDAA